MPILKSKRYYIFTIHKQFLCTTRVALRRKTTMYKQINELEIISREGTNTWSELVCGCDLSIVETSHEMGWKITPFPRARLRFNQVWFRILEFVYWASEAGKYVNGGMQLQIIREWGTHETQSALDNCFTRALVGSRRFGCSWRRAAGTEN